MSVPLLLTAPLTCTSAAAAAVDVPITLTVDRTLLAKLDLSTPSSLTATVELLNSSLVAVATASKDFTSADLVSGSSFPGVWAGKLTIPSGTAVGTYTLRARLTGTLTRSDGSTLAGSSVCPAVSALRAG